MCSNPCKSELTCFRPESNRGPYGLLIFLSAALSTTELWWRANHRKSFTKKRCFSSQQLTRSSSTMSVSASSHLICGTLTCLLKQSNLNAWSMSRGNLPQITSEGESLFFQSCLFSHRHDHAGLHYVTKSACLKRWIAFLLRFRSKSRRSSSRYVFFELQVCGILIFEALACTFHIRVVCKAWEALLLGLARLERDTSFKLFWNRIGVVRFVSHEVLWFDQMFAIWQFLNCCREGPEGSSVMHPSP